MKSERESSNVKIQRVENVRKKTSVVERRSELGGEYVKTPLFRLNKEFGAVNPLKCILPAWSVDSESASVEDIKRSCNSLFDILNLFFLALLLSQHIFRLFHFSLG